MKVLITGAGGNIGVHLTSYFGDRYEVTGTYHQYKPTKRRVSLDITDQEAVMNMFDTYTPDLVIHSAALADASACHKNPDLARIVNVDGSRNVARACAKAGVKMIHISTDMVFDGKRGGYSEDDNPSPINVYGKSKARAEEVVLDTLPEAAVLRTAIVYGTGAGKRPNFFDGVLRQIKEGVSIKILTDEYRSYLYVEDVAAMCQQLISGRHCGVFHVGGVRSSRYDIVKRMLDHFELDDKNIIPVTIAELREKSPRPADLSLECSKTLEITGFIPTIESEGFIKFERLLNL